MNINMLMQQAQRMQKDMESNIKKAKEELGYKNRDMKDTIKDTISWLNKKGEK